MASAPRFVPYNPKKSGVIQSGSTTRLVKPDMLSIRLPPAGIPSEGPQGPFVTADPAEYQALRNALYPPLSDAGAPLRPQPQQTIYQFPSIANKELAKTPQGPAINNPFSTALGPAVNIPLANLLRMAINRPLQGVQPRSAVRTLGDLLSGGSAINTPLAQTLRGAA